VPIGQEHVIQARDALFPTPLTAYPPPHDSLVATLSDRVAIDPFNAVATGIFLLAILHTFAAARFAAWSHRIQHRYDEALKARGLPSRPSVAAEFLHFFGEVEVVFGLWVIPLLVAATAMRGWETVKHYVNETVVYQEPLFVVVIMALASTRPIITFAEEALRRLANLGGGTPGAWWLAILIIGPLLGSFITEPAAMTISALLLARQFYDLDPGPRLKYATLGLLFVNVSIGGTLTHFAAPPVLMVARVWEWDTPYMLSQIGWRSVVAIVASTLLYYAAFRGELAALGRKHAIPDVEEPDTGGNDVRPVALLPVPMWLVAIHVAFMAWTVVNVHYTALFIGSFLIFLGFARATAAYQSRVDLRGPLLVGFFLAGLVIHGGLQGWWIAPVLASLSEEPLFLGATILTAFNDNALITYLATLVPDFSEAMKLAVVEGAVTGGGLTIIANAPNPAGQAILSRFFGGVVLPIYLFMGALVATLLAIAAFRLLP
jgi:hypothetical protein